MRADGIWICLQRLFETDHGLRVLFPGGQCHAQIVQDFGLVRSNLQDAKITSHRFIPPAEVAQGVAQVEKRVNIVRFGPQGFLKHSTASETAPCFDIQKPRSLQA